MSLGKRQLGMYVLIHLLEHICTLSILTHVHSYRKFTWENYKPKLPCILIITNLEEPSVPSNIRRVSSNSSTRASTAYQYLIIFGQIKSYLQLFLCKALCICKTLLLIMTPQFIELMI